MGGSGSPLSLKKSAADQNSLDSWEPWDNFWNPKMKIWVDYAYWRRKSSNNFAWTLGNDFWTDQLSEVYLPDTVVGFQDSQVDPVPGLIWGIGHLGTKNQYLAKELLGCLSPNVITFGPHSQPSCQMTIYRYNWDCFKRDNWPSSQELFDLRFISFSSNSNYFRSPTIHILWTFLFR